MGPSFGDANPRGISKHATMAEPGTESNSAKVNALLSGQRTGTKRNLMDRFIDGIELIAAFFVGIVALDIFVSVLLRYFFAVQIPDSYDFGRLLLGILIFWGIAATSYRGNHITVDLLYSNVGERMKRVIDVFATLVQIGRAHV